MQPLLVVLQSVKSADVEWRRHLKTFKYESTFYSHWSSRLKWTPAPMTGFQETNSALVRSLTSFSAKIRETHQIESCSEDTDGPREYGGNHSRGSSLLSCYTNLEWTTMCSMRTPGAAVELATAMTPEHTPSLFLSMKMNGIRILCIWVTPHRRIQAATTRLPHLPAS